MVKTTCPKCNHLWEYKGKSNYYITCPRCYRKVKVIKDEKMDKEK